jgi:hypothetical protein
MPVWWAANPSRLQSRNISTFLMTTNKCKWPAVTFLRRPDGTRGPWSIIIPPLPAPLAPHSLVEWLRWVETPSGSRPWEWSRVCAAHQTGPVFPRPPTPPDPSACLCPHLILIHLFRPSRIYPRPRPHGNLHLLHDILVPGSPRCWLCVWFYFLPLRLCRCYIRCEPMF